MKALISVLTLTVLVTAMSCKDTNIKLAQENKAMVTKAFEVVSNGDFDNMGNYIAENYVRHSQATPDLTITSLEEFKEFIKNDRLVVPDQRLEIESLVAEGNMVAFWATYIGTQTGQMGPFPPSGKTVSLDFSGVHRIENGKIAETWVTWDNVSFLSQIGQFPPPQPENPEAE